MTSPLCIHSIHLVQVTHNKSRISNEAYLLNSVLFALIVRRDAACVLTSLLASSQETVRRNDGCFHASSADI